MNLILVIESTAATRATIKDVLLQNWSDLTVITTSNGSKGLHQALDNCPDVILIDGDLQGHINGLQVAKVLRHLPETKSIPLIALTTNGFNHQAKEALLLTCNTWLQKPILAEKLLDAIQAAVNDRQEIAGHLIARDPSCHFKEAR